MPAKKPPKAEVSEHDINGHSVRVVSRTDHEELWIDSTRRRFFRTEEGYVLFDRAYVPSHATLLGAVREYLKESEAVRPGKQGQTGKKSGGR